MDNKSKISDECLDTLFNPYIEYLETLFPNGWGWCANNEDIEYEEGSSNYFGDEFSN
jgi:hypothetical protein